MKNIYLLLMIVGLVLPYSQFMGWLGENGIDPGLLTEEIINSKLSLFAWLDVVISAIVLIVFILYEGQKLKMNRLWIPIVGTLSVGVSFGLPLFLYLREIHLQKGERKSSKPNYTKKHI